MPLKEPLIARISASPVRTSVRVRALYVFLCRIRLTIGSNGGLVLRVRSGSGFSSRSRILSQSRFCHLHRRSARRRRPLVRSRKSSRFQNDSFAGGGTSLRGFALNQAGPRDPCTGFPVGGQAMLVLNQEFRFPMRLPFIGTQLGGALFYDGGNVYSRLDHITLRAYPPKPIFALQDPSIHRARQIPHCASTTARTS